MKPSERAILALVSLMLLASVGMLAAAIAEG